MASPISLNEGRGVRLGKGAATLTSTSELLERSTKAEAFASARGPSRPARLTIRAEGRSTKAEAFASARGRDGHAVRLGERSTKAEAFASARVRRVAGRRSQRSPLNEGRGVRLGKGSPPEQQAPRLPGPRSTKAEAFASAKDLLDGLAGVGRSTKAEAFASARGVRPTGLTGLAAQQGRAASPSWAALNEGRGVRLGKGSVRVHQRRRRGHACTWCPLNEGRGVRLGKGHRADRPSTRAQRRPRRSPRQALNEGRGVRLGKAEAFASASFVTGGCPPTLNEGRGVRLGKGRHPGRRCCTKCAQRRPRRSPRQGSRDHRRWPALYSWGDVPSQRPRTVAALLSISKDHRWSGFRGARGRRAHVTSVARERYEHLESRL